MKETKIEKILSPSNKYNGIIVLEKIANELNLKAEDYGKTYEVHDSMGNPYICVPLFKINGNGKNIELNLRIEWSPAQKYRKGGGYTVAFQQYCKEGIEKSGKNEIGDFDKKVEEIIKEFWGPKKGISRKSPYTLTYIKTALGDLLPNKNKKELIDNFKARLRELK